MPRRVFIFEPVVKEEAFDAPLNPADVQSCIDSAWKTVRTLIRHEKHSVFLVSGNELICAVADCSDKQLLSLVRTIRDSADKRLPLILAAGLDGRTEDYRLINSARLKAEKALKTCLRSPNKEPRLYDTINMEIFSGEIPDPVKKEYISRIFKSCGEEEISSWITVLDTLYLEEGSISRAADKLFMHKNTLQYRLNKLKKQTGYDPRSIRFSSLFYNAIHFYRDLEK